MKHTPSAVLIAAGLALRQVWDITLRYRLWEPNV